MNNIEKNINVIKDYIDLDAKRNLLKDNLKELLISKYSLNVSKKNIKEIWYDNDKKRFSVDETYDWIYFGDVKEEDINLFTKYEDVRTLYIESKDKLFDLFNKNYGNESQIGVVSHRSFGGVSLTDDEIILINNKWIYTFKYENPDNKLTSSIGI